MKKLNKKNTNYLLKGNSWFTTGGGFPAKRASKIFTKILKKRNLMLESLDEFDDIDYLCVASGVGSVKNTDVDITRDSSKAIKILEETIGVRFKGLISGEIGLECLAADAATKLGLPLVDVDMKGGRAAPEPSINMFNLRQKPVTPIIAINTDGDMVVLKKVSDPQKIEIFLRHFANMAQGCFVAWCPRRVMEYKKYLISGTISRAIDLGSDISKGKTLGELLKRVKGKVFFNGTVKKIEDQKAKGFLLRKITIKDGRDNCQIWVKNENLMFSINNKIMLTCPDLITIIDPITKQGIHNATMSIDCRVLVVGIPNGKAWHTRRGYNLFGPQHFQLPFKTKSL